MMMISLPFPKAIVQIRTPTQTQLISLRVSLTRKEREVANLYAELTNLKNRLAILTNKRKLLNEAVRARDPPIKKLSPEVLQEIFVLCLPAAHHAVMSAREAPMLLCRVCHGWRRLAHATPRLWTSIHVPLCYDITIIPMPSPDDVTSWLSRSKSLPVSMSLYGCPLSYGTGVNQMIPYLDCITSVENRWKSLHLSTTSVALDHVFSTDQVLGSLEELHIDSLSWFNLLNKEETFSSGWGKWLFPKLLSLSLPYDALAYFRRNTNYKKLTQLAITRPDYGTYELSDIVEVLHSAPLLRSLSLSGFHASDELDVFSHHTIHFSDLESLSITNYRPYAYVWPLLTALHTPLLRYWKYYLLPSHDGHPIKEHLNAIYIFISRLNEPLEEFDLHIHSFGTEFRRILAFVPGLKRLSLARPLFSGPFWFGSQGIRDIGDFHLKCLIEDSQNDWESDSEHTSNTGNDVTTGDDIELLHVLTSKLHCPRLEVIKCACLEKALTEEVLLDFLRIRTGRGAKDAEIAPLKKVDIFTEVAISDGLQEEIRRILDGTGTLFQLRSSPRKPPPKSLESMCTVYPAVYQPTF